jgi:hypothetical protein
VTTIAANRECMAADSLANTDGRAFHTRKLYRVRGALIGISGGLDHGMMFVRWYAAGADLADRPKGLDASALALDRSGLYRYESECYPMPIEDGFAASGSGAYAALAAMHMGATPKEAVEVACKVDVYTGPPVVVERLWEGR